MAGLLVVSTSFPESRSGEEAAGGFVHDFARALSARVPVTVVAPGRRCGVERDGDLHIRRFAVPRLPLSLLRAGRPAHWPAIAATLRAGGRAVSAAGAVCRPEHALGLWALPCGAWLRRLEAAQGVPYALWALGSDIWSLGRLPLVRGVLSGVLRGASHRFADGVELAEAVTGICARPCEFLPSSRRLPVPQAPEPRSTLPVRLAFLGRWHPNKGTDLLLEALRALHDDDWACIESVRINGGGPLEEPVTRAARELAARGRPVEVGGYLDAAGAAELLTWTDYLVIPSRIESIPVIFSDAMQARCPVISMPVGDLPRLVERHGVGVVVESVDAASLARGIAAAVRRPASDFAAGLAQAAQAFDVDRTAETVASLLQGRAAPG